METQFTPGPWCKDDAEKLEVSADVEGPRGRVASGWVTVWNPERPTFCAIVVDLNRPNVWSDELLDANAHLIAAAPELYAAAKRALNYITNTEGEFGITFESGDMLRAALAKARGDQQ